ncbi:dihydroorotase [Convivina praedatoris]|uniref:Dihydroorotase n=1 Tax=Convivina praedatoris TaxID=2880963 RepID=A0ABN8H9G1_9LACO|nr:dihydroorotase [Convivina sp. LMG 32447]CAH1852268.1 Dihydroorotase [Convivina sp. LMG 32447]CAH1853648.1 Dihydroorotase [Convivina sp. LMG 32447]CAH1854412.1 Dihydroorotase [Convivina sp. LMG 32447]
MQLIKEAQILNQGALVTRDVLVDQGKIVEVAPTITPKAGMTVYSAHGSFLTPGLVDVHVHFRDPGYTEKETIKTGSMAAAAGGFTTVLAMPNLNPVPDTVAKLEAQIHRNQADGVIHVGQYGAISADLTATEVADIKDMAAAGAVAFTNDGKGVQMAETMYQAMQAAALVNKPLSAHLEDDSMLHGGVMNAGKRAVELGLPGITPLAESSQLARDLVLAQATGVHYHVAHISTKTSVELVRLAKQAGIKVTAEVSPHHLLLSENDITEDDALLKMNPPLRSEDDRQALIAGLLDGTIDMIATDHAPHTSEEKAQSMRQAPFGITGIETSFALMYTHLVQSRVMDLATLVDRMLVKPVQAFNLSAPTEIKAGVRADLALFDLENQAEITADQFYSKGRNSPFIGWSVYGTTVATWVAGQQVFERN